MKMGSLALGAIFWIASLLLTLWIVRCPSDQLILSASLCALSPVFALILTKLSGGRIVISGRRTETRPDAIALLFLPSLGLAIRALGPIHIINWQAALICAAVIGIVWSGLAYFSGTFGRQRGKLIITGELLLIGLAYGYGVVCLIDTIADNAPPKITEVTVLNKYVGAGRGHTPYLVLAPSTVNPEGGDEAVSQQVYQSATVEQKVCLVEHPGAIGLEWYEILTCERKLAT
jgi:hypothetical protein